MKMTVATPATVHVAMIPENEGKDLLSMLMVIGDKMTLTICVQRLPVRRSFGVDDGRDDRRSAGVKKDICLLIARLGRPQVFLKLILDIPDTI